MEQTNDQIPFGTAEGYFADAAETRTLKLPKCRSCGKVHWYPRIHCPFCFSADLDLIPASGAGTIYSYSVVRRATKPYAVAVVELQEGPRIISNIVESDLDGLEIGQKVRLSFFDAGETLLPGFRTVPE